MCQTSTYAAAYTLPMRLLVCVVATALLLPGGQMAPDPCLAGNHMELNDLRRSPLYRMPTSEAGLCDNNLIPNWYRFTSAAGGIMSEHCLQRSQCGTLVPIWMNGTHPSPADDIVQRSACAMFGADTGATRCCDHHIPMFVKNCGAYYVYFLYPTPTCPVAYCAGNKAPCPAGKWSSTGVAPCSDVYPLITTNPTMVGPELSAHSFRFRCRVNYPGNDPRLRYEVQWTFDNGTDTSIPNQLLVYPRREAILPGTAITGHMDHLLRCKVRAWYDNPTVPVHRSPWRESNEAYYLGIRVSSCAQGQLCGVVLDDKTNETRVRITSTVPIVCDHSSTSACCLYFNLNVDGQKDALAMPHQCTYKLCTKDWNPQTHEASTEVVVSARKNQIVNAKDPMRLSFERLITAGGGPYFDVFNNYSLPDVPIKVNQTAPLRCSWTGDPHITSFSRKIYHLYEPGDFIFYENSQDDFVIQSRTYVCGRVACQCGLIIKEQNDVIHISNCHNMTHAPVVETNHEPREGTVIQRSNDGMHLMIYLPSGREVRVDTALWKIHNNIPYHNVYLTVPSSDKAGGGGRGICGTPDDSATNEYTHRNGTVEKDPCLNQTRCVPKEFEESWRLDNSTSLFHVLPPPVSTKTQMAHYCQCDDGVTGPPRINCTVEAELKRQGRCPGTCTPFTPLPIPGGVSPQWSTARRDVSSDYVDRDVLDPRLQHSKRSTSARWSATWPTPGGITESQARERCLNELKNAQLYSYCQAERGMINDNLDNCMLDVLFLDSFGMVESSTAAFTDACQYHMIRDINNYHPDSQGHLVLSAHVTNVCSTACMRHGRCVDGTCVCDAGFAGSSCQLVAGQAPQLLRVRGSSLCDVNVQPCRRAFFDADKFEGGEFFQCKVQEILANGRLGTAVIKDAVYITSARLACPLPPASGSLTRFSVSMTYDSHLYSNALRVTVYDSTCQTCDDEDCSLKAHTCLIDNQCYQNGDVKPGDASKRCVTSQSTSHWSSAGPVHSEGHPVLTTPTLTGSANDDLYTCTVHSTTHVHSARYEVTWEVSGQEIEGMRDILMEGDTHADISLTDFPDLSGDLACKVRSFFVGQPTYSEYVHSNSLPVHV